MCEWADRIICVEQVQADYIVQQIDKKYANKIEILNLQDTELFMSPKLIENLEKLFKI
jgi:predicted protein tyrosine phosphatase